MNDADLNITGYDLHLARFPWIPIKQSLQNY
jgi:hypothetical protein